MVDVAYEQLNRHFNAKASRKNILLKNFHRENFLKPDSAVPAEVAKKVTFRTTPAMLESMDKTTKDSLAYFQDLTFVCGKRSKSIDSR